jgi:hypothetical protein
MEPKRAASDSAKGDTSQRAPEETLAGPFAEILRAHNELRAKHCASPLTWSKELANYAQGWADTLVDDGCRFDHNPDGRHGENLSFYAPPDSQTPASVAQSWYDEIADFNFKKPSFSMLTGHFTQLVWRETAQLGCGVGQCNGGMLWVCNYDPAGNVMGSYENNVLPEGCGE